MGFQALNVVVPGPPGPVGPEGQLPFATLTAPFDMPAVQGVGTAQVDVGDRIFRSGLTVFTSLLGYLQVVGSTINTLVLYNPGYSVNRPPGVTAPAGNIVLPAGVVGPDGPVGPQGPEGLPAPSPTTRLAAPFTIPPVSQIAMAQVASVAGFAARMFVQIDRYGYFVVATDPIPPDTLQLFNYGSIFNLPPGDVAPATALLTGTGPEGAEGPVGPIGPAGQATVLVGEFGHVRTVAELPPDGAIPINWDGPGRPPVAHQMIQGESIIYHPSNPLDVLYGHLFTWVGTGVVPSGWLDVGNIAGPPGPGLAPGGSIGQVLTKRSNADQDTEWGPAPTNMPQGMVADVQPNEMVMDSTEKVWATINATGLPPVSSRRFLWICTPSLYSAGTTSRSYTFNVPGIYGLRELMQPPGVGSYPAFQVTLVGRATTDTTGSVSMEIRVRLVAGTPVNWLGNGGGITLRSRIQVFDMGTR